MKMRNWLKTTLAAGLVAATGAVMVGCGCDTEISYKDAMTAYHEVIAANGAPTADFLNAAKDGFTLEYTMTKKNLDADGKTTSTDLTTMKVESITGENGLSRVTKETKAGDAAKVTTIVNFAKTKASAEATDTAYYFYDGSNKKILQNGASLGLVTINKDVINFATAYQTNILVGILGGLIDEDIDFSLLDGKTELLAEGSEFKDETDPVAKFNEKYNKELSAENTTKTELKTKLIKSGENNYKLTLAVVESTWKGADKTADVATQEVTFEIKDKTVTKMVATTKASVEGKATVDISIEATVDYKKPTLTAAANLTGEYAAEELEQFEEFLAQFPNKQAS